MNSKKWFWRRFRIRVLFILIAVSAVLLAIERDFATRMQPVEGHSETRGTTHVLEKPFFVFKHIRRKRNATGLVFVREVESPQLPFSPSKADIEFLPQLIDRKVVYDNLEFRFPRKGVRCFVYRDGSWIETPFSPKEIQAFFPNWYPRPGREYVDTAEVASILSKHSTP